MLNMELRRRDICKVDFGKTEGSEQGGVRPAIIIQNDIGNKYSPTVIVCPITSQFKKKELPTHVNLENYLEYGLEKPSQVIAEQIATIDKSKILKYIGSVDNVTMNKVDIAIEVSVSLGRGKTNFECREIKLIKNKIKNIEVLDSFINVWLMKNDNIDLIKGYITDRDLMIKDLERYSSMNNIDYKDYYNPMFDGLNDVRLVG